MLNIFFLGSFHAKSKKNKESKLFISKQSTKPFEIVEALGIVGEVDIFKREKTISPWKDLAHRWSKLSLSPTPQRDVPIQIKSLNDFQKNSQQKRLTKKFKKKALKANPAMSRLTRLASTKINISNMDMFADDEDNFIAPSSNVSQNHKELESILPSSLPYVSSLESSLSIPPTLEYLKVVGLIDQNQPTVYHRGHNRSSASHLGYSASKPEASNFIMPLQPYQPLLEDNLRSARVSTIDHYSHLKSGSTFEDNNTKSTIEEKEDDDASTNRGWNQNYKDDKQNVNKKYSRESRLQILKPYRNEEFDAYNSSNENISKGIQNTPKTSQSSKESHEQTSLQSMSTNVILEKDQPMYRRVSASGHVSLTLQPSTSSAPSHESPFADYTKHGLRENPKLSMNEGFTDKLLEKNDEATLMDKENMISDNKLPLPLTQTSNPLELAKVGTLAELKKGKLQQSSSGHISEGVLSTINTLPHESSFADYSKHGIREQPIQQDIHLNSIDQSTSNPFATKHEKFIDPENQQNPLTPTSSNFVDNKRSPWASETGDPSHSKLLPLENSTIPLAIAKPNDTVYTSNIDDSSMTISSPQISTTSRVSLYSSNDVPSYTQILGVVPCRRISKSEEVPTNF